ncbi:hypothetical protein B0H14DRAFT_3534423 [Mycena olivaceomarginata]|nr:hypothetical protein B0H14DRAFT_3534423 [Mycena olivaceomarginata]
MTALNSPLPPATATAVRASANRATALVAEADRERAATWDASLRRLEQEWVDNGWPESSSPSTANELTWEWAFMRAHNAFRLYVPPRYTKILRARLRRYQRLKYLHELAHPPFFYPAPSMGPATWGAPSTWEVSAAHDQLLGAVLKQIHELVHPPFTHPEFPEDPALTIWKANGLFVSHRGDSVTSWGNGAADLTEADDEISPIRVTIPLPFVSLP